MTQPAWRTGNVVQGTSSTPSVLIPAAAAAGDYAIVGVSVCGANASPFYINNAPSSPSGSWTLLGFLDDLVNSSATLAIYGHTLTSADIGGTHSVGWSLLAGVANIGILGVWSSCTGAAIATIGVSAPGSTQVGTGSNGVNVSTFTGAGVLNTGVTGTSGFPTSGTLITNTSAGFVQISYTGTTATSFTGCTTVAGSGTLSTGTKITTGVATAATGAAATSWDGSLFVEFASLFYGPSSTTWTTPGGWTNRQTATEVGTAAAVTNALLADQGATSTAAYTPVTTANFVPAVAGRFVYSATLALAPNPATLNASTDTITLDLNPAANAVSSAGIGTGWPQLITEVAFNVGPNDPDTAPFWTDISDRVKAFAAGRGSAYELAQPSAGSGTMLLDNADGALDPNNTSSPYYPNLKPMRRYRMTAIWQGVAYPLWSGNVRSWPQAWQSEKYSLANAATSDALSTLQGNLLPVIAAAMQVSEPTHLWPFADSLAAPVSGGPDQTWNFTDEGTSPLTLSMSYPASATWTATVGASLPLWDFTGGVLPADSSEGLRITGSVSPVGPAGVATDGISLFPKIGQVVTWELWGVTYSTTGTTFSELLAIDDGTTTWLEVLIEDVSGTPTFLVTVAGTQFSVPGALWDDGHAHHVVITADATNPLVVLTVTVDSLLAGTFVTNTAPPTSNVNNIRVPGPFSSTAADCQVIALAMYQRYLGTNEISDHLAAYVGYNGLGVQDTTGVRVARILKWGDWNGPTIIDAGGSTMQAAAGLGGSTIQSAIQQCVDTEFGSLYLDAAGNLVFGGRVRLASTTPAATFGENGGTEIPYEGDIEFSLDPTYVYDRVVVQRSGGMTATVRNPGSTADFFPNTLSKTIYSDTDTDAQSQASYLASQYAEPANRVSTVTIDVVALFTADAAQSTTNFATLLALDIGSVVTVIRRGVTTTSGAFRVQQIADQMDATQGMWKRAFQLSPLFAAPTW